MSENKWLKNSLVYLIIIVAVIALWFTVVSSPGGNKSIDIGTVVSLVRQGQITKITTTNGSSSADVEQKDGTKKNVRLPDNSSIYEILKDNGIPPEQFPIIATKGSSQWGSLLGTLGFLLPTLFLVGILVFMMRQAQGSNNQAMSFGKSRARMFTGNRPSVTFTDVAGVEEAKQELAEVVEFLKYPDKFAALGARIPRGVLLVGPPGTGKTLLSRAVAGEAGVPFFSISGSEFVEMFVGVGASRVRDLFDQAKRNAPCIIFVDEIDAVGRQRGAGLGGSHDEREQTLNQILVEMDGFDSSTNIIVIAATNRPDVLDPALLRPGRFDRQVILDNPDIRGRQAILEVHTRGKPIDDTVTLEEIARQTPGFSGADLENLVNEAAILAARRNLKVIGRDEVAEAIDRVIAGPQRKSRLISERERIMTAYHEAGHALVARVLANSDPVHKISIVARGMMGGYTRILPDEDRFFWTKAQFKDRLAYALGGHVTEELVFQEVSTGASNDIEQVTNLARKMVTEYGMSKELGPIQYGKREEMVFLGRDIGEHRNYSDDVAFQIDKEVRKLVEEGYERARQVLTTYMEQLHQISALLLEKETVDGDEIEAFFHEPKPLPNHVIPQRAKDAVAAAILAAEEKAQSQQSNPAAPKPASNGQSPPPRFRNAPGVA
ncbi:MAG: ATP-dependent zinc metalloprotease FtsH [Chloroflexota bacterium]|nr:ATP-dependent zinc metalloprotease FtsH [Chloroflexota bacterium]